MAVSNQPEVTATYSDNSILFAMGSTAVTSGFASVFDFWIGHRPNNIQGSSLSSPSYVGTFDAPPRVSGLDKIYLQMRMGITASDNAAGGGNHAVNYVGNLYVVKYRDVMTINSKQAYLMGGKPSVRS